MEAASVQTGDPVEGQQQEGSEGQEGTERQEGAEQPGLEQIFERLDEMGQGLKSDLEQRFAALQEAAEPEGPDPVAEDVRQLTDPDGELSDEEARGLLERMFDQRAQEMLAPVAEELAELRGEREQQLLVEEFPEFKDPGKLQTARQAVYDMALEMTRGNEQLAEWLASQRPIIRATYLAGTARREPGEQPGEQSTVDLETPGAAVPGQGDPDEAVRQSIREAAGGERNSFLTG